MSALRIEAGTFPVPFKVVFKHTSAARAATENVIVRVTDDAGNEGYGEGCPRSYVTGETESGALAFLSEHASAFSDVEDLAGLREQIETNRELIDANPAAFCALELALIDLLARRAGRPVDTFLGVSTHRDNFAYSAVLGDSGPAVYRAQVLRYRFGGLRHYKLKISGDVERDRSKLRWFRGRLGRWVAATVRIDANNLWSDPAQAIAHLRALDYPFLGIEEPLAAGDHDGFLAIAEALDSRIILDESLLRSGQVSDLPGDPSRWILNCRVSKSGGLVRSVDLITTSVERGLGVIVGAHVGETSLLTRAGLVAATAAGDALLAQEGAFGTFLLSSDITASPLMFGRAGQLEREQGWASKPGLGIDVVTDRLTGMRQLA